MLAFATARLPRALTAGRWFFVQKMVDLRKSKATRRNFTF
jgi:hypothetical protein